MWKFEKKERKHVRGLNEEEVEFYWAQRKKTMRGAFLGSKNNQSQAEQVTFQQKMLGMIAGAEASTNVPENPPAQPKPEEQKVEEDIAPHGNRQPVVQRPQSEL